MTPLSDIIDINCLHKKFDNIIIKICNNSKFCSINQGINMWIRLNKFYFLPKLLYISWMLIWSWSLFNLSISFMVNLILRSIYQNRSGPKLDFSREKKNLLIAKKHKRILSREVQYWIRIWPGEGDDLRAGAEKRSDGYTNNGDGSKGRCPDLLLTYIL